LLRGRDRKEGARRAECKACALSHSLAYHAAHPEVWERYYMTHHVQILLHAQAYYYEHQEERMTYHHAWTKANPEKANLHGRQRKAKKRSLPSTLTAEEQAFCRAYFHYACAVCGNEEGFRWLIALDHWIPLDSSACPGTIATNMIPLCHGIGGCNNSKGTKEPGAWLVERCGTRKATAILKRINAYFAVVRQRQAS